METAVEFTEAAVLVVGVDREGLMAAVSAASSIWQTLLCRQFFSLGGVGLDGLIDQQGRAACDLRCLHEAMPGHGVKRHRQLTPLPTPKTEPPPTLAGALFPEWFRLGCAGGSLRTPQAAAGQGPAQ